MEPRSKQQLAEDFLNALLRNSRSVVFHNEFDDVFLGVEFFDGYIDRWQNTCFFTCIERVIDGFLDSGDQRSGKRVEAQEVLVFLKKLRNCIATYESAPAQYGRIISFSGNITDLLSLNGSIGLNFDSSGYFGDRSLEYYYYSNSDNKTYVRYNSYPSQLIGVGESAAIYFDPFHFATTGANLIAEQYAVEIPYTSQDSVVTLKTKMGCVEQAFNYSLRARETNSGDAISIHKVRHELTTQKVSELLFPVNVSDTPTATDVGILTNQSYCGGNYFADDFVGDKRLL